MKFKVVLTAGGTGGHIFPALAVAEELKDHSCDILFAAGNLSQNIYFNDTNFAYKDISCSPFIIKGMFTNTKGVLEATRLLRAFKPDVVIGFGSYYTLPILIAAKWMQIPILLHEANSIPGRVNRLFAPFANKTWTYFPQTKNQLKGIVQQCKMPLRPLFKKGMVPKVEAKKFFNLNGDLLTILIFGGSQGARALNGLFSPSIIKELKKHLPPFQLIHFTGTKDKLSYKEIPHYITSFERRIDLAWAAADIAVTRAGASSVAEQILYEVPGLLIPYPMATDNHQEFNADFLVETGLGIKVIEEKLTPAFFMEKMVSIYQNRHQAALKINQYKKNHSLMELSTEILHWLKHYQKL